jgi:outer membrane protein TolC
MRLHLALVAVTLAGCAVGPDFRRPASPEVASYTAEALPAETAAAPVAGGEPQRFVSGEEIPPQWWALFRSEALDRLIRQALSDSPTLAAAQATLRVAEENRRAQFGAFFPGIEGNASGSRSKISGALFGAPGKEFDVHPL